MTAPWTLAENMVDTLETYRATLRRNRACRSGEPAST